MHCGHLSQLTSLLQIQIPLAPLPSAYRRSRRHHYGPCLCITDAEPRQEGQQQIKRPDEYIKRIKEFGCSAAATAYEYGKDMLEKYELAEQVGKGSFGIVHAAINRETGERVAVKTMAKRFGPDGYLDHMFVRRVLHEVDILQHLGCSLNVAYCFGAFEERSCVGVVLEMCAGGELWSRIKAGHSEKDAARLVREILRTVAQCHSRNVIIRDVKPDNFLFLSDEESSGMRAIDFGLAEYCEPGQYLSDKAGTVIYIAPEVLRGNYTLSADVWSVGIIAYLLLTGRLPFGGEDGEEVSELFLAKQQFRNRDVFRAVLYSPLDFESPPWDTLSGDAREVVQGLLQRDAGRRLTALEALRHRWLQEDGSSSGAPIARSIVQRLQRFGTYGRLKQVLLDSLDRAGTTTYSEASRANTTAYRLWQDRIRVALRKVAHSFTEDSQLLTELRALFDAIDTDNSGTISHAEMLEAMKTGQWSLSDSEVSQLLAQLEVTPQGAFDYGDWIAALVDWKSLQESSEWDSWIEAAFNAFDVDGSGRLDTGKLNQVLCGDVCLVDDTVEAALREADIDHDGSISLRDFETLMRTPSAEALELFQTGWQQELEKEL